MFVRHCERQSLTQFAHVSPGSHFPSPHRPTRKSVRVLIGREIVKRKKQEREKEEERCKRRGIPQDPGPQSNGQVKQFSPSFSSHFPFGHRAVRVQIKDGNK